MSIYGIPHDGLNIGLNLSIGFHGINSVLLFIYTLSLTKVFLTFYFLLRFLLFFLLDFHLF